MSVHFQTTTTINAPSELVFDLSLSVDFHMESLSHTGEQAIAGVTVGTMGLGDTVTWRARHFGIWWKMTSKITQFDRPNSFVDEQDRGPFTRFRHRHTFEERTEAITTMIDDIWFDAPLGPLGDLVEAAVLGRYLQALIEKRNVELKHSAEALHAAGNPS